MDKAMSILVAFLCLHQFVDDYTAIKPVLSAALLNGKLQKIPGF